MASSPQQQQHSKAIQQQHQLQWTNLTPFPYQRDIAKVADALGLARRYGFLQDRVIFFRPCVRRKCPNGIMTERVMFITPNGMLHLCDNDAAPKRTLALTELLSVVTDSVSQIALITDWPLVLRFEMPRNASSLPGAVQQIPTLKNLISLVKFFRPSASLLRCTPEDFSTVNLNLGKPRQFRAPASFDALLPPPDKSLDALMEEQQQQQNSNSRSNSRSPTSMMRRKSSMSPGGTAAGGDFRGDGMVGGNDLTARNAANALFKTVSQKFRNAAASRGSAASQQSLMSPQKRSVQFSNEPNRVVVAGAQSPASGYDSDYPTSPHSFSPQKGGGTQQNNNNVLNNMTGSPMMMSRPEPPKSPTDFWAHQQNALFDQYANNSSPASSPQHNNSSVIHRETSMGSNDGSDDLYYSKVLIDPKIDKVIMKPAPGSSNSEQQQGGSSNQNSSATTGMNKKKVVLFDKEGNPLPETPETTPSRSKKGAGQNVSNSYASVHHQDGPNQSQRNNDNNNYTFQQEEQPVPYSGGHITLPSAIKDARRESHSSFASKRMLQQELAQQQQQHLEQSGVKSVSLSGNLERNNNNTNNNNYQGNYNRGGVAGETTSSSSNFPFDDDYFRELPAKFEGKTGNEVEVGVAVVKRLEDENEFLRREVLELQLREKRMRNDPIPLGRVLPLEAAYAGAQVRNLGILITSICKRRKMLGEMEAMMAAQQEVLQGASMLNSDSNNMNQYQDDVDVDRQQPQQSGVLPPLNDMNPQSPSKAPPVAISEDDI